MRNTLSHMKIQDNLDVQNNELAQYFLWFENLVDSFKKASYFNSEQAKEMRHKLHKVRQVM